MTDEIRKNIELINEWNLPFLKKKNTLSSLSLELDHMQELIKEGKYQDLAQVCYEMIEYINGEKRLLKNGGKTVQEVLEQIESFAFDQFSDEKTSHGIVKDPMQEKRIQDKIVDILEHTKKFIANK